MPKAQTLFSLPLPQPGSPDLPSHQPACPSSPSGAAPPSRVQRAHLLHRSPEILSSILTSEILISAFKFQILYFFHCSDVRWGRGTFASLHQQQVLQSPKRSTKIQIPRILSSTIHHIAIAGRARTFRVTMLPTSTLWTADAIGPLLPKGCQVLLQTKF